MSRVEVEFFIALLVDFLVSVDCPRPLNSQKSHYIMKSVISLFFQFFWAENLRKDLFYAVAEELSAIN